MFEINNIKNHYIIMYLDIIVFAMIDATTAIFLEGAKIVSHRSIDAKNVYFKLKYD